MRRRSALRGRYLVRNPAWNAWLRISDSVLALRQGAELPGIPPEPRRVLVAIGGHMGDAVMATAALARIRQRWPAARLGVLTGSWNRAVMASHPAIEWIHEVDHWKLNRGETGFLRRYRHYRATKDTAIRAIAATGYDLAIDLYPYYPNSSAILAAARVPVRVGYRSGGGGPRYSHSIDWEPTSHATEDHERLLRVIGIPAANARSRYSLGPIAPATISSVDAKLRAAGVRSGYVVFHMGAGSELKAWPATSWQETARRLTAEGHAIVLTGRGDTDRAKAQALSAIHPQVVDMCDRLDVDELREVLSRASLIVSVDTAAAHLAAAANVPTLVLMAGIDDPARWRPLGDRVVALSAAVPCAPCHRKRGCASMACVRTIAPDSVVKNAASLLSRAPVTVATMMLAFAGGCGPCSTTFSCTSDPTVAVTGSVLALGSGSPVAGAVITMEQESGVPRMAGPATTRTDRDGNFLVKVGASEIGTVRVTLTVAAPGKTSYRILNFQARASNIAGDGTVLRPLRSHDPVVPWVVEVFRNGTADQRVPNAPIEFRRTSGVRIFANGAEVQVIRDTTDAVGWVYPFLHMTADAAGEVVGDLVVRLPAPLDSTVLRGATFTAVPWFVPSNGLFRAGVGPN